MNHETAVIHLLKCNIFLSFRFKMTRAVIIREKLGDIEEIELDITPEKNEIYNLLGGNWTSPLRRTKYITFSVARRPLSVNGVKLMS